MMNPGLIFLAVLLGGCALAAAVDETQVTLLLAAVDREDWAEVKRLRAELKKKEEPKPDPGKSNQSFFQKLGDSGFSLKRSPSADGKTASDGAYFGFTDDYQAQDHPVFNTEFYLRWSPDGEGFRTWTRAASVQGKLSSTDDTTSDAWIFRFENDYTGVEPWGSYNLTLNLKEESDRDFDVSRLGAELWLTPTIPSLAMGQYTGTIQPGKTEVSDPLRFRWRPYLGADIGEYLSEADDVVDSPLWLMAKMRADVALNFLKSYLQVEETVAYIEGRYIYLTGEDASFGYLNTGIDFNLTENFGISFNYTTGQTSPKFVREKVFKGGFTVRF